jgi:hypothetical protein
MHTEPIHSGHRTCALCAAHRCGYRTRLGRWVGNDEHDVCARCWESLRDGARARDLAEALRRERRRARWTSAHGGFAMGSV